MPIPAQSESCFTSLFLDIEIHSISKKKTCDRICVIVAKLATFEATLANPANERDEMKEMITACNFQPSARKHARCRTYVRCVQH